MLTTAKKQPQSKWLTGSYRCVLHRYEEETSRKKEPNHGTKKCSPVGINSCSRDYVTTFAACGNKQATTDENGKPIVNILVRRNVTDHPMQDTQYTKDLEAACDCTIEVAGSLRQRVGPAEERQDGRR